MRTLWMMFGLVSLALGVAGLFLPLLPTTPFLLLSAFAFSRSSPAIHAWLIGHRVLGPPIRNWEDKGAISRRAKVSATVAIALTPVVTLLFAVPLWALGAQGLILAGVLIFIWTRPEGGDLQGP